MSRVEKEVSFKKGSSTEEVRKKVDRCVCVCEQGCVESNYRVDRSCRRALYVTHDKPAKR